MRIGSAPNAALLGFISYSITPDFNNNNNTTPYSTRDKYLLEDVKLFSFSKR